MKEMLIEFVEISRLNPAKYNPRKDLKAGDPAYEKLLMSIEEFGYIDPMVWNRRTGNLVGGHQRLKILKHLGYTKAQCVILDIDDTREKAVNVALNKAQGQFDEMLLAGLLHELVECGFNAELTGFDQAEQDKLFQSVARQKSKLKEDNFDADSDVSANQNPLSQRGDVWLLGRHKVMCGDSTNSADVAALMGGRKAVFSFFDPPYNVFYGNSNHPNWKRRTILNDNMSTENFGEFLRKSFTAAASVSEFGASMYCSMSAKEWGNLMLAFADCNYHWSSTIIWVKNHHVMARNGYHTQYEPIWYGWLKGNKCLCPLQDRKQSDIWEINRPSKSAEHPTMKPIALVGKAIENSSRVGDLALDFFGGSGTTLIAAEQTERTAFLMELDERYVDCIVNRYINFRKNDDDVFLLRDGEKLAWKDVPEPEQSEQSETAETLE